METNLQRKLNETVSVAVKPGDLVSRPEANNNDAMDEVMGIRKMTRITLQKLDTRRRKLFLLSSPQIF